MVLFALFNLKNLNNKELINGSGIGKPVSRAANRMSTVQVFGADMVPSRGRHTVLCNISAPPNGTRGSSYDELTVLTIEYNYECTTYK